MVETMLKSVSTELERRATVAKPTAPEEIHLVAKSKHNPAQPTLPGIDPDLQQKLDFAKPGAGSNGKKKTVDADGRTTEPGEAREGASAGLLQAEASQDLLGGRLPDRAVNELSALEGNAGKPIYQMSKWWARRRSSVFRAMLIAAAMEAPARKHPDGSPVVDQDGIPVPDETEAVKGSLGRLLRQSPEGGQLQTSQGARLLHGRRHHAGRRLSAGLPSHGRRPESGGLVRREE